MAQSPQFKVYSPTGEYIAACKYPEDAAALVSVNCGGKIKYAHSLTVWSEGAEAFPAGESYDGVAEVVYARIRESQVPHLRSIGWSQDQIAAYLATGELPK